MQNNLWVLEKEIRKLAGNFTLKANALIRDYIVLMYFLHVQLILLTNVPQEKSERYHDF